MMRWLFLSNKFTDFKVEGWMELFSAHHLALACFDILQLP